MQYSGILTDNETLEKFIYDELNRRLSAKTAHIRKSALPVRSTNVIKKVVRKIVSKKSGKRIWHCSVCGKSGHTKVNCPKLKRTKKVNHIYQDEVEDPEDLEEYIIEKEEAEKKEEKIEEEENNDVKYIDEGESRNCYAVKKSGAKRSTYENINQEVSYFQVLC